MFAHQVIEDLKNLDILYQPDDKSTLPYKNAIKELPVTISSAQKFHFGNTSGIVSSLKYLGGSRMFLDFTEYCKLPFEVCWFDWICDDKTFIGSKKKSVAKKRAALVFMSGEDLEDLWSIFLFWFNEKTFSWVFSSTLWLASIGCNFNKRPISMNGTVINGEGNMKQIHLHDKWEGRTINEVEKMREDEDRFDLTFLQGAILLLNCKNIVSESVMPPERLNRKRIMGGKSPLFEYKVLKIRLPKGGRKNQKGNIDSLYHNRIHICRGHFKEYTKDNPLMGRHVGLFWWAPHVRGQNTDGIVVKDYNVEVTA